MSAKSISQLTRRAIEAGEGILRLTPTWVPRSFLVPGRRLKLATEDLYAFGAHRGGIDERWLASTTEAMNENRTPDEGLSYVVADGERFTLRDAVESEPTRLIGRRLWTEYQRWPVYSKFFDNLGPIPHHLHQNDAQAQLVGRLGKPEAYYFPPQMNFHSGYFPHTYFGLEPGTTKTEIQRCLERWECGDNGILDYSKAYRLRPGTGWLVPPGLLHAPGSLVTYEPQWGSDVLAMFQSMVDGRYVPWDLLVQDVPLEKRRDLGFLIELIDWPSNTDPNFKAHHYLEPIHDADTQCEGFEDRWILYGQVEGRQCFTAKELTVAPGAHGTVRDHGASGLIVVQGQGRVGAMKVSSPNSIRFGELTDDELFVSDEAARQGIEIENFSAHEPLVLLRYFGPDANPQGPFLPAHANGSHTGANVI
ncbi:MAG: hypothetical protein JO249_05440 [Acidobacteria bacterium]|nr:hypothetical protein [Acidobacteriota bacterium]